MFDIGFVELLVCGVIALIVLGPERLPAAARAAGRWVGAARRMVSQFSSELDSQLKAEELREELRKAGDVGLGDVQKSVRGALNEAKKYEHMVLNDKGGAAAKREPTEDLEPDEDPTAANNSGHSSLEEPELETEPELKPTDESQKSSPDNRT